MQAEKSLADIECSLLSLYLHICYLVQHVLPTCISRRRKLLCSDAFGACAEDHAQAIVEAASKGTASLLAQRCALLLDSDEFSDALEDAKAIVRLLPDAPAVRPSSETAGLRHLMFVQCDSAGLPPGCTMLSTDVPMEACPEDA